MTSSADPRPHPASVRERSEASAAALDTARMLAGRAGGTRMVVLAYAVALAVAVLTGLWLEDRHPVAVAASADVAATLVVFAFSYAFRNSSFYDPYWSVVPPVIAVYWAVGPGSVVGEPARQLLVFALVAAWGARLTWNWWRGWTGLHHEDWRYRDLQEKTGRAYWLVSLLGIHLFPTVQVFLGCLALYPAAVSGRPLGALDALAAVVTGGAIALEALADRQLHRFRRSRPAPDAVLESGVWAWSRHPNYLGEIGFWWGLWLFALAADPAWWWTAVGPLAITVMFWLVSLPMIETRMLERRPGYADVQRRVPILLPRPPRRSSR